MSRQFCQSLTTGAVLPYNDKLARRQNVRVISEEEALRHLLRSRARGVIRRKARDEFRAQQTAAAERLAEESAAELEAEIKALEQPAVTSEQPAEQVSAKRRATQSPPVEGGVLVTDLSEGEPSVDEIMEGLGM